MKGSMKYRLILLVAVVSIFAGVAFAEYRPEYDVYVHVDAPLIGSVTEAIGLYELGLLLFGTQEDAHEALTDTTGLDVDHYYVWLCLNGECLPADPFTVNR